MSNLIKHAQKEFKVLGWDKTDCEMQQAICENILELLKVFSEQGHTGSTAPYVIHKFKALAMYEPLSPLTGEDAEWNKIGDDGCYQNNRCSEVFKESKNGKPYWIKGKIFKDKDGCTYTNSDSFVDIDFPWVRPEPEIVEE